MNFKNLSAEWRQLFKKPAQRYTFLITIVILISALNFFAKFLIYVETRQGVYLQDPLFKHFIAVDFNTLIFILIYGSLLTGLISLLPHPRYLILALQTYSLMVLFRFMAMYLTPLEVPEGIINLRDPLVFTLGTGQFITKDLFFSGHIASLTILFFTAKNKYLKWLFLLLTIIVAGMIFMQKAHYSIDMLVAPFFAFMAYSIAKTIDNKIFMEEK